MTMKFHVLDMIKFNLSNNLIINKMKRIFNILLVISLFFTVACSQEENGESNAEMTFKEDLTFDYGKIKQNSNGIHEFEFKNTGSEPLIITNVKSSCGCTIPSYPKEPVTKNKKEKINVKYDTKRIGIFNKTITVYSNAKNSPVKLRIKGEVYNNEKIKNTKKTKKNLPEFKG